MRIQAKILQNGISNYFNNLKSLDRKKQSKYILFFILVNALWFIFRTGSKASRITYPCQQAAVKNISFSLSALIPLSITIPSFTIKKKFTAKNSVIILSLLLLGVITGEFLSESHKPNPFQNIQLKIESKSASVLPASDIFVVNNQTTPKISELIELMSSQDLFFFKSNQSGEYQGPEGLIGHNDIILLKINSQWSERGGTNTDLLKDLIETIIAHPDGFFGEIVVADNGQGYGGMDHTENNAENTSQSTQDVVDMFSSIYNVSTYNWAHIRGKRVDEYSEGDMDDGYIVYEDEDPETGIKVSYPKFKTDFDSFISFKYGLWNGTNYEKRLKVINLPVLKSHVIYGTTASLKNYMGVQSESLNGGLANGHASIATGGMGTLMVEFGLPILNIIDAIWVNANPYPASFCGPATEYHMATRVNTLVAGIDPIALDYWASKHILMQTAKSIGYDDTHTLDPENIQKSGLEEAFGVWLNLTKEELLRGKLNVTTDENKIAVITNCNSTSFIVTRAKVSGFELSSISILSFLMILVLFLQKRTKLLDK